MKNKYSLMGKIVTVKQLYKYKKESPRSYAENGYRKWYAQDIEPRAGWVVGYRYVYDGKIINGYENGNVWKPTKAIPVLMVTYWPTMKPEPVPMDAVTEGGVPHAEIYKWNERDKQTLRDTMKYVTRDEKGRWMK